MMKKSLVLFAVMCFSASLAFGVMELGPTETYQEWGFDTPDNPAPTTMQINPFAQEPLLAVIKGDPFSGNLRNENGVWTDSSLSVTMVIPNNPVSNPYKEIKVEMKYQGQVMLSWVKDLQEMDFPVATVSSEIEDLGNGWKILRDTWRIEPNPYAEKLCYGVSGLGQIAALDYIHVYTNCIPEPATLALMGLGLGFVIRRKK
jgi:hypothetical protein